MSSPRFQVNEALIINTGVNDVEHLTLDEVIQKQLEMVDTARKAFPGKRSLFRVLLHEMMILMKTFGQ
jgi:hypothetical protein